MTDQEREQTIELMASEICKKINYRDDGDGGEEISNAEEVATYLQALKWPCSNPRCKNGQITYYEKELCGDERLGWVDCPDCKGTGYGEELLAGLAKDQTPPEVPEDMEHDAFAYLAAQADMIKGDETGKWRKVLK